MEYFVTVDGDLETLPSKRWDNEEGIVCDLCDRLAETTYDFEDYVEHTLPVFLSAWRWGGSQVCPLCVSKEVK